MESRFPNRSVENAGGAGGAVGKGSDEGAGLSARLGPAISGERRMDFLPLYLNVLEKSRNFNFRKEISIETISRKLKRESPSPEISQRFPGIAFTAFVTPCSIGSREEESNWFTGCFLKKFGI